MDWLVFGDDWGAHVSTTQHLVRHLPAGDRVLWIDSIGMRTPTVTARDAARMLAKARGLLKRGPAPAPERRPERPGFARLRPLVLPLHGQPAARAVSGRLLARQVEHGLGVLGARRPVVLTVNPVAWLYRAHLPTAPWAYLRLDDYAHFPGVEPALIHASEPDLLARARLVAAPAQALVPPGGLWLPQGVDAGHFAQAPLTPPAARTVGFFGLVGPRIDHGLVAATVAAAPGWTFEFVGRIDGPAPAWLQAPNVVHRGPVPYADLPLAIAGWAAAWTPYRLDADGLASDPLKIREYLAAGLPTHCTSIPAVQPLVDLASEDPAAVAAWLQGLRDSAKARAGRRARVAHASWAARAQTLRATLQARLGVGDGAP